MPEQNPMYPKPTEPTFLGCLTVLVALPLIWGVIFAVYGIIDTAPGPFATLVACLAGLGLMGWASLRLGQRKSR